MRDEKPPIRSICVLAEQAARENPAEFVDLSERTLAEREHFFAVYKDLDEGR